MDPFTQKLLEKTRQRREQLQQKLQTSTDSASARKRKPLQEDNSEKRISESLLVSNTGLEEKRRKSAILTENIKNSSDIENDSKPIESRSDNAEVNNDVDSDTEDRKGRLQKLAKQINNWEDDLSHPTIKKDSPQKKVWQPPVHIETENKSQGHEKSQDAKPPKPPRLAQIDAKSPSTPAASIAQASTASSESVRRSPRLATQPVPKSVSAFAFGTKQTGSGQTPCRKPAAPLGASTNSVVEEPTAKAVADRFAMWEKKTTDALTPLRQAAPIGGTQATPVTFVPSLDRKDPITPASQQTQTTEFRPSGPGNRRRSRSANNSTPNFTRTEPPPRETTGSTPWQKSSAGSLGKTPSKPNTTHPPTPAREPGSTEEEWCKLQKQDVAFQQAPMSAKKNAWESKIAEQQAATNEHNKIMYRTRSATRLDGTPCQKQQAENQLKKEQEKVHDPAEKAKRERQAELDALKNRFNNKGLLQSENASKQKITSQQTAQDLAAPSNISKTEDDVDSSSDENSYEVNTYGLPNRETLRQVSFKSPTQTAVPQRRKSDSPESDHEKKVKRRSSCKIPTLGYTSSSDDEAVPTTKIFPLEKVYSPKHGIPSLGDESSADSLDFRQTSGSSLTSSVSSASFQYEDKRQVTDFLDEAMSDEDCNYAPIQKKSPAKSKTPEQRRSSTRLKQNSPAAANSVFSIDQYRKKTKSVSQNLVQVRTTVYDTDDTCISDSCSVSSGMSDEDRRRRIKELQGLVQVEQNVIIQASNALNQCCQSGSSFAGSTEQVECNRLLLIACQRRQAYLSEIERLKSSPNSYGQRTGKGSLTISDIQLPLKREFVKSIGTPEDNTVHYFVLMVRAGAQVIVTQMVSTHDSQMRGTLHFPNLIKLNDITNDFKYELEIYGMQVSRESKLNGKKDKKKAGTISRSKTMTDEKTSAATVRTTSFTHITSLMLTMDCVQHTAFKLSRVPYLSPLQGTIHLTLRCTMEANVVFKGFINMFEDVGGFGAWHRRWCVLSNNKLCYWKYPDDEKIKEPIGQLNLKDCITPKVGLVSRDKCARPNTIEIMTQKSVGKPEKTSRDKVVTEQHWLGLDTKEDRVDWCDKLNEALANVRHWYSDAAQPLPSKRKDL